MTNKPFFYCLIFLCLLSCSKHDDRQKGGTHIETVKAESISSALYYSGMIKPIKSRMITSPVDGVIEEQLAHYGDEVKAGQVLFVISSEKFKSDYKTILTQYVKAKSEFENAKGQVNEAEFLHKNQLISDDEYKSKKTNFYNTQLALIEAKDNLVTTLKTLDINNLNIDNLSIANIEEVTKVMHLDGGLNRLHVVASVSGTLLLPIKNSDASKKLEIGDQVKMGDVLAEIGDTNGVTIQVNADEMNINEIRLGQQVKVTGVAFPSETLLGEVSGIDREAAINSNGTAVFPIEVQVKTLTPAQKSLIHIGMSAKVELVTQTDPKITIPFNAIAEKDGKLWVKVRDGYLHREKSVEIKAGPTTASAVVVNAGLQPGDKIVVPN